MTTTGLTIVDPRRAFTAPRLPLIERPQSPDGLVLGLREFWFNYERLTTAFEAALKSRYQVPGVQRIDGTRPRTGRVSDAWEEFKRSVGWALVGFGGCGGCAPWAVMDAVELEALGVPTVTSISEDLMGVARRTAESSGYPQLRILALPHYIDDMSDEDISNLVKDRFEDIVGALTLPLDG